MNWKGAMKCLQMVCKTPKNHEIPSRQGALLFPLKESHRKNLSIIRQKKPWREGVGIEPTNDGVTAAYRF